MKFMWTKQTETCKCCKQTILILIKLNFCLQFNSFQTYETMFLFDFQETNNDCRQTKFGKQKLKTLFVFVFAL